MTELKKKKPAQIPSPNRLLITTVPLLGTACLITSIPMPVFAGPVRCCVTATGCSCCASPPPLANARIFDFAWDGSLRARATWASARLTAGIALLAFAIWSWSSFGNAWIYFAQLTQWGLTFTFVYLILAGLAGLGPTAPAPCGTGRRGTCGGRMRGCATASAPQLLATAFTFEVAIVILSWATFTELDTVGLGSFIVKHSVPLVFCILDVGLGRVPIRALDIVSPLVNYVLYTTIAGIYSVSEGKGPYEYLYTRSAGETVAAVFVALAVILLAFGVLFVVTAARERGIARAAHVPAARAAALPAATADAHVGGADAAISGAALPVVPGAP